LPFLLPLLGIFFDAVEELAGFGGGGADVGNWPSELEAFSKN